MPLPVIAPDHSECPICGNPANKSNTHLIPWFIIKSHVTEKGIGVQDKQLSYTISPQTFTKVNTGRCILPEQLEQLGDLHEMEIEKDDPFARDHLWCAECEKKFSRLESIFSAVFSPKKLTHLPDNLPLHHGQRIWISPTIHDSVYQIFIQSIFWRCSKGRFDGFELDLAVEKKLLANLQAAFGTPNALKLKATDELPVIYSFPLITSYLHREDAADPTANYISTNKVRRPYMIIGGRWIFQLFEKPGHIRGTNEYLYGLRFAIDTPGIYPKLADKPHVVMLNESTSDLFINRLIQTVSGQKVQHLRKDIRHLHQQLYAFRAPPEIENHVVNRYIKHLDDGKPEFESLVRAFDDLKDIEAMQA